MEENKKTYYTQHKNEYTQKYIRENYKQLSIRIPIDGDLTRETIAAAAAAAGKSVNAYILDAVALQMETDKQKNQQ